MKPTLRIVAYGKIAVAVDGTLTAEDIQRHEEGFHARCHKCTRSTRPRDTRVTLQRPGHVPLEVEARLMFAVDDNGATVDHSDKRVRWCCADCFNGVQL